MGGEHSLHVACSLVMRGAVIQKDLLKKHTEGRQPSDPRSTFCPVSHIAQAETDPYLAKADLQFLILLASVC